MFKYAGIGSRQTPEEIIQLMILIAKDLSPNWLLRTGYAQGADAAFHYGCEVAGGAFECFIPWDGFNGAPKDDPRFFSGVSEEAFDIASKFHPAWNSCSDGAKKLHARNVYQITGRHLDDKVDMVICWTPEAKRTGGTGQALRIAEFLQIPIFDLADPTSFNKLVNFTNQLENLKS